MRMEVVFENTSPREIFGEERATELRRAGSRAVARALVEWMQRCLRLFLAFHLGIWIEFDFNMMESCFFVDFLENPNVFYNFLRKIYSKGRTSRNEFPLRFRRYIQYEDTA